MELAVYMTWVGVGGRLDGAVGTIARRRSTVENRPYERHKILRSQETNRPAVASDME